MHALVNCLLKRMVKRGFNPWLFETLRSPERGDWLQEQGKTKNGRKSLHCYGAAADIICRDRKWDHPEFFKVLGQEAKAMGLTWGGDWGWDKPHVQAISVKAQHDFRLLSTPEEREAFIRGFRSR